MSPAVNLTLEEVPFAILEAVKARILANRRQLGQAQKPRPSLRPRPQFRRYGASSKTWRKPQYGAAILGQSYDVFNVTMRPSDDSAFVPVIPYFDFWNPSTSSWMELGLFFDGDVQYVDFIDDPMLVPVAAFVVDNVPLVFISAFAALACQLDSGWTGDPCEYAMQAFVDAVAYKNVFPSDEIVRLRATGWVYIPSPASSSTNANMTIAVDGFVGGTRSQRQDVPPLPYPPQPRLSLSSPDTVETNIEGELKLNASVPIFGDSSPSITPGLIAYININVNDGSVTFEPQ